MKIMFCDMEFDYGVKRNGTNAIGGALQNAFQAMDTKLKHYITMIF